MTVLLGLIAIALAALAVLLALSAGLFALSVVLSYSIAWFERVNGDPAMAGQRHHALAARLLLSEYACLLLTLLLRPFGWLPTRIPAGPCRRPPVILLHGLFMNRSCLFALRWRLRAAGFDRVISINTPQWHGLDTLVGRVAQAVTQARTATGAARVHLVGHSMGGILARCYLQQHGGAQNVATCVTLGSPHRGTKLARFAVSRLGRALLPCSALLARLNAAPLPDQVAFTAIYSRHDNMIVPMENAGLDGADNVELAGMGHTAMLFSAQVAEAVVKALKPGLGAGKIKDLDQSPVPS